MVNVVMIKLRLIAAILPKRERSLGMHRVFKQRSKQDTVSSYGIYWSSWLGSSRLAGAATSTTT